MFDEENKRLCDELGEIKRRHDQQRASLEHKSAQLDKQVMDLTSELSKVNRDVRDTSANYELRIETLETKLQSSNDCLQVK